MKKIKLLILSVCLSGLIGCSTLPEQRAVNISRTSASVKTAAQLGVFYAVKSDPSTDQWFRVAHASLTVLINQNITDPNLIRNTLGNIKISGVKQDEVQMAVMGAVGIYEIYAGDIVRQKLSQVDYLIPVLTGLRDGLALGLNIQATAAEFKPNP